MLNKKVLRNLIFYRSCFVCIEKIKRSLTNAVIRLETITETPYKNQNNI